MGDRTNPIKFGPEWLRNLSSEPTSARGVSGRDSSGPGSQGSGPPGIGPLQPPNRQNSNPNTNISTSKVRLAKLRYGREEMLALYDNNTAEAPPQLKAIEGLYLQKPKPPYALNMSEEESRDTRGQHLVDSGISYTTGMGRAIAMERRARSMGVVDPRGKGRGYNRQTSIARGWGANPRNAYSGMPDEPNNPPTRPLNNNTPSSGLRPTTDQSDWSNKAPYRAKRPTNTNWRQQSNRDEGLSDGARRQDKWERDWPERSGQDKPWQSNRRSWVGAESDDQPLPEWAVGDNSNACGGTFDSSGAFHGYSNDDDSNLPKSAESHSEKITKVLTMTHPMVDYGAPRCRYAEESSEGWWASDKAKKLSPKRFDAIEIMFKKPLPVSDSATSKSGNSGAVFLASSGPSNGAIPKGTAKTTGDKTAAKNQKPKTKNQNKDYKPNGNNSEKVIPNKSVYQIPKQIQQIVNNNTKHPEESLYTVDKENTSEDKGKIQSVMMTGKNVLREKHQSISTPLASPVGQPNNLDNIFRAPNIPRMQEAYDETMENDNKKLVEDVLVMNLDDNNSIHQMLGNRSKSQISKSNPMKILANVSEEQKQSNPPICLSQNNLSAPTSIQGAGCMMQPLGVANAMLYESLGIPVPINLPKMPIQGITLHHTRNTLPNQGMLPTGLEPKNSGGNLGSNIQPSNLPTGHALASMPSLNNVPVSGNMAMSGMPLASGLNTPGMQMSGGVVQNAMQSGGLQGASSNSMTGLQSGVAMPNNPMFLGQMASANNSIQNSNDLGNNLGQQNMFAMHNLAQRQSPVFNNSLYADIMEPTIHPPPIGTGHHIVSNDLWYYQDPTKDIQGPFSTKEMAAWYAIGFFNSMVLVRRSNEPIMRPLGTYGPLPFGPTLPAPLRMHDFDTRPPAHENNMKNPQPGLGPHVQSLWDQQPLLPEMAWMQSVNRDNTVSNVPVFYYERQPPPPLPPTLPKQDESAKEMTTQEELTAELAALMRGKPSSRPTSAISVLFFDSDTESESADFTPNLQEINDFVQLVACKGLPPCPSDNEQKQEKSINAEQNGGEAPKTQAKSTEGKQAKIPKAEEKPKNKDNGKAKAKEEIKEDVTRGKPKEDELKSEKRSEEPLPSSKNKKDDKSKKDLEKEKKEWIKDGFTIVKGADKKDKKKNDEGKVAEEAERKRKGEEKNDQELRKRQMETFRKQQGIQNQQQQQNQARQAELVNRKAPAPWSATNQGLAAPYPGPTLAEIQRLEREKKLEQMKEQQLMMQLIALQQQAALTREQVCGGQDLQGGLGWTKKQANTNTNNQTLAEIQAEARRQTAAAAAATAAVTAREEAKAKPPTPVNVVPWGNTAYSGAGQVTSHTTGFWDTSVEQPKAAKPVQPPKPAEPKPKKKVTVVFPKKEISPSADFVNWCSSKLESWREASIDVPTFISFLRDIESPYEVKDYVKCYLGDTKESNDFARQFLERRSRLLRVGMVTPSDDLCSPAIAVNPRTNSSSDHTDVKGKGKKTKKNKMLKVDARNILGFSVTAAQDRVNVGDIDTV